MTLVSPGITRVVFAVDIEGYSRRLNLEQMREQERLDRIVRHAFTNAGTGYFARQDSGDGVLLILESGIDQAWVLPRLLTGLRDGLEVDNRDRGPTGRIRLRASLGEGTVHVARTGFASGAVIEVCRFLNSGPLKAALREAKDRDLVTAVTDHTYKQVVQQRYPGLDPSAFREVLVTQEDKGFSERAWIDAPVPDRAPAVPEPRTVEGYGGSTGVEGTGKQPAAGDGRPRKAPGSPLNTAVRTLEAGYLIHELKQGHPGDGTGQHGGGSESKEHDGRTGDRHHGHHGDGHNPRGDHVSGHHVSGHTGTGTGTDAGPSAETEEYGEEDEEDFDDESPDET
ncbi:hypothetical protein AB0O64_05055 [Streptomyces sp. NPDC088341]|uniref:hypothetical protein n=1 Tax=Streptomyces sp. NPDC088341 TaxID=3154870 RepID=UPI003441474B